MKSNSFELILILISTQVTEATLVFLVWPGVQVFLEPKVRRDSQDSKGAKDGLEREDFQEHPLRALKGTGELRDSREKEVNP